MIYIYIYIYMRAHVCVNESVRKCLNSSTSPQEKEETKGNFLKQGLNSEFSFSQIVCHIMIKEPSVTYNLPIAGEREKWDSYIFQRVLALNEMQLHPGFNSGDRVHFQRR